MTKMISKIIWVLSLVVLSLNANNSANEAILSIDSGGHQALINKNIIVTKSGDIITASDDKTIKFGIVRRGLRSEKY